MIYKRANIADDANKGQLAAAHHRAGGGNRERIAEALISRRLRKIC